MGSPPPHHGFQEDPWAKFFLIGVCVTVLDLLLYPYLKVALAPYLEYGGLLLFFALGIAAGYLIAWRRGSGYVFLIPAGAVIGLVVDYELDKADPTIVVAILVGVAASGLSVGIGGLLA
jgi:hypothetical protein